MKSQFCYYYDTYDDNNNNNVTCITYAFPGCAEC